MDFQPNDMLIAMEEQLRSRTNEIMILHAEVDVLKKQLDDAERQKKESPQSRQALSPSADKAGAINATLMAQIQFLHGEVDRQEKELQKVRVESAHATRAIHQEHARVMQEKLEEIDSLSQQNTKLRAQIAPLQRKAGKLNGEDLFERCKMLEKQLATAIAERSAAMVDKHDTAVRMRKLEAALRGSREAVVQVENIANEEADAVDEQVRTLHSVISALSEDREQMKSELEDYRVKSNRRLFNAEIQCEDTPVRQCFVQTDIEEPPTVSETACQVDTLRHFGDSYGDSVQAVAHSLEVKCNELDTTRADLDRLCTTHNETLSYLEMTKSRLSDELKQRKLLEADNEKLIIQVRALQQQNSQLHAQIREQQVAVQQAEQRAQHASNVSIKLEEDRRQWESDMQVQQQDMQQIVANQNLANQQIAQLAQENDTLREELQRLLQREAQCNYAIKSKDAELQELIACYQAAVREGEKHANAVQSLNREGDNLRAGIASREERIAALMDQINQLHSREQQLAVDLQSCDYEGGVLHRKLVQSEADNAALHSHIQDLQNQLASSQRVTHEFERSNAELQKQLVIKENEAMLTRSRCDEVEHHLVALPTAHNVEHQRLVELEEQNARMAVKGILAQHQQQRGSPDSQRRQYQTPSTPPASARSQEASYSSPSSHQQQYQQQQYSASRSASSPQQQHQGQPAPLTPPQFPHGGV